MAVRENSVLHAALIIFVMITVILAVSCYFYFRSAEEEFKLRANAVAQTEAMEKKFRVVNEDLRVVQYILGWETTVSKEDIEALVQTLRSKENASSPKIYDAFKQDMAKWGEGIDNPNYRNVSESLLNAIKDKGTQVVSAVDGKNKAQAETDSVTIRETKATATHDQAAKTAQTDRANEMVKFEDARKKLNDEKRKLQQEKDELATRLNNEAEKYKKMIQELEKDIKKLAEKNVFQKEEIDRVKKADEFEVPDGKVTYVNQRLNSVLINLGSADGMRTQVAFSVYDRSESSATKAKKKGGIEVTKVLDEHTSEARITKDSIADPILPGDQIYSPVWHAGPRLHFALTGFLDIDGDGENDRQTVRNLIEVAGGIVDAEQDDNGTVTGKMTFQTKYLIDVAELPERTANAIRKDRNEMIMKAKELGVKRLYLKEFLDYMQFSGAEKTVRLGSGSSAVDPKAKEKKPGGSEFRPREAPAAKANGAF